MNTEIDRIPPHSIEAEQGVIGCLMLDAHAGVAVCQEQGMGEQSFYDLKHQEIYSAIVSLCADREPVDLITLQQRLKDTGKLESIGGIVYLSTLQNMVPSAANLEYYAQTVREKAAYRRVIAECTRWAGKAYDASVKADEFLDRMESGILAVSEAESHQKPEVSMGEYVRQVIDELESAHQNQGLPAGLRTGFPDLDRMTGGLQPQDLIVIAARPSMGKTSFAMNIAEHVALEGGHHVGIISLEMSGKSVVRRMLCGKARVDLARVRDGDVLEGDFPKLAGVARSFTKAPIHIEERSGLSILQIRAKARRWAKQHALRLLVVDYLQLATGVPRPGQYSREREVADISKGCKEIAKELNIPVIVLAQLNRDLERDKNRKPRMSDLRESGAIEQDADLIGFLWKPSTDEMDDETDMVPTKLMIEKHRNGRTGIVHLLFNKPLTRFESVSKIDAEDQPTRMQHAN